MKLVTDLLNQSKPENKFRYLTKERNNLKSNNTMETHKMHEKHIERTVKD